MEEKTASNPTSPATPAPRPPVSEVSSRPPPRKRFSLRHLVLVVLLLVVIGATAWYYVKYIKPYEDTDDAFIESYVAYISPRISGPVTKLSIVDNQRVKEGDELLEIDPQDYQTRVAEAEADLATAQVSAKEARVKILVDQAKADEETAGVASAQATAARADADRARYDALTSAAVSRSQLDLARTAASTTSAEVQVAQARAKAAAAQVDLDQAEVLTADAKTSAAETRLAQAKLDLSYTKITAPRDGQVTKRTVELGAYVQTGQALLALVPDEIWVVANFKETQLEHMKVGQPVTLEVDAYPHHAFKGRVDSFQDGAGARFSLLPPENAVGNYVKVVQRVPVKIVFDDPAELKDYHLAPGMSVVPKVRVE